MHNFITAFSCFFGASKKGDLLTLVSPLCAVLNLLTFLLIKLCECKLVSNLFVFLKFFESLRKFNLGSFLDRFMEIAVLEHFLKSLSWDFKKLTFWTFTFG